MKEKLESIFKRRAKLSDLEKKINTEIDAINKILINYSELSINDWENSKISNIS